MPNQSPLRNPPPCVRALLVAATYALPGAIAALIMGVLCPYPRVLLVSGVLVGAAVGLWMELH